MITTKKVEPVSGLTFEPETLKVGIRSASHSTALFSTMYIKLAVFSREAEAKGR
jgi:hypothetical protein